MTQNHAFLIYNASQLLTLKGGPQRGHVLGELGILLGGAVVIDEGIIVEIGQTDDLLAKYPKMPSHNANGHVVMPGFVDPHTHLVWVGDRAAEFEMRLQGKTYMEILEAGGGILSTVNATREAPIDVLIQETRERAWTAFSYGTTTVEVKTGYGLTYESELKQLKAILKLNAEVPIELVPTFLAAHAIPPEFKEQPQAYVDLVCQEMLPELRSWWEEQSLPEPLPFVDVFCEKGAFDLVQSRQILETATRLGFPTKIHADEFANLGGTSLAVELGATSADHLVKISPEDIQALSNSDTVAVSLPGTPFGLNDDEYTPCKAIIEANGLLALATDTNPGTSWCESMQFMITLACRKMGLTPAQAIAAATINSAAAIGRADRIGSIEVGKQADLIILSVNDFRHLGYRFGTNLVSHVVKKISIYPIV